MIKSRILREIAWAVCGLGIPFLVVMLFDLSDSRSLALAWQRVQQGDVCAYGGCIFLPVLTYGIILFLRAVKHLLKEGK